MSYETHGRKWGDDEVGTEGGDVYWSSDLSSGLQFGSGDSVPEFEDTLQDAFDAWESVADINFIYTESGSSDISVGVGAMPDGYSDSVVGYASWSGGAGTISSGTLTFDEEEFWAPYGSGGVDFYAVALHEIGHLIGLSHVSGSVQIMNASISADVLQSGDIAGAQYLYGPASVGPAPEPEPDPEPGPGPDPEPDAPDAPESESPPPSLADDGGSSGGALGAIVALLGLVVGMLFSGGAGVAVLAAGRVADDDDAAPDDGEDDIAIADLIPVIETMSHAVYVDDAGNFVDGPDHDHGCDCGQCCGADDDMFLV